MILCPHGCGIRLHPPTDDKGEAVAQHEPNCSALHPEIDRLAVRAALLGAPPPLRAVGHFTGPRASAWDAYAAAAMTAMIVAHDHEAGLDYAGKAAQHADRLLAERDARFPHPKANG